MSNNVAEKKYLFPKIAGILLAILAIAALFIPVYLKVGTGIMIGSLEESKIHSSAVEAGQSSFFYFLAYFGSFFKDGFAFRSLLKALSANKIFIGSAVAAIALLVLAIVSCTKEKGALVLFKVEGLLYLVLLICYSLHTIPGTAACFDLLHLVCLLAIVMEFVVSFVEAGKEALPVCLCLICLVAAFVVASFLPFVVGKPASLFVASTFFQNFLFGLGRYLITAQPIASSGLAAFEVVFNIAIVYLSLNLVITYFQMGMKRNRSITVVRYALLAILAVVGFILSFTAHMELNLVADILFLVFAVGATVAAALTPKLQKEAVAEQPVEEVAEQPAVEEAVEQPVEEAEEPVAEEAVEQPVAEEAVEQPVEEVAEEPVAEEAEQPVEEVAEQPAVEEAAVAEPAEEVVAVEAPEAAPAVATTPTIQARYRRSYLSKLHQSDEKLQKVYSQVKNCLLSFKKVKSRISWKAETFRVGRKPVAKMIVRGKTLNLYLALDPKVYEGSKYFFEDVSNMPRFAGVPMRLKVRSARSVKWAVELIQALMGREGVAAAANYQPTDFTFEALDDEAMLAAGLIKEPKKK